MAMALTTETFIHHPELSYEIVGAAFSVFNELGAGLQEKTYEDALVIEFKKRGLKFQRQLRVPVEYMGVKVGTHILDFLVEEKIVVELKVGNYFERGNINQLKKYLVSMDLSLGIILNFTRFGVRQKRIVNGS